MKQSLGVFIPSWVIDDEKIPWKCKLLYAKIFSLTCKEGFCWATNETLSQMTKTPFSTVRKHIDLLTKLGLIRAEIDKGYKRRIYLTGFGVGAQNGQGGMPTAKAEDGQGGAQIGHKVLDILNNKEMQSASPPAPLLTGNTSRISSLKTLLSNKELELTQRKTKAPRAPFRQIAPDDTEEVIDIDSGEPVQHAKQTVMPDIKKILNVIAREVERDGKSLIRKGKADIKSVSDALKLHRSEEIEDIVDWYLKSWKGRKDSVISVQAILSKDSIARWKDEQ